jgi:hypothetical protein
MDTFLDWKIYPKDHLETQKTTNSKRNTEQKEQHWGYHNIQIQTILQSHSNKNSILLAQQWNRIEDPDMNPCTCTQLIFDKGTKHIW